MSMIAGNLHPLFLWKHSESKGAVVEYHDSYVPVVPPTREHAHFTGKQSVDIEDGYDLILLSTDHAEFKEFDFQQLFLPSCGYPKLY